MSTFEGENRIGQTRARAGEWSLSLAGPISLGLALLAGCETSTPTSTSTSYSDICDTLDECMDLSDESYDRCVASHEEHEVVADEAKCTEELDRIASCYIDAFICNAGGGSPCDSETTTYNECLRGAGKSSPACQELNQKYAMCCPDWGVTLESRPEADCAESLAKLDCATCGQDPFP